MPGWLKLAIVGAAAYFAYDYFVTQEHWKDWQLPGATEVPAEDVRKEDLQRSPGRGLNPFVTDDMPGSAPQRPRVPKIPGT